MAEEKKNLGGRPPYYTSPDDMQKAIDRYFESCKGEILKDKEGENIYDKYGSPVIVGQKPPTVTGLALALGFTSRLALLNYEAKEEFVNTVTRAKAKVEEYAESRLFDKDGSNGAKFSLANNFRNWTEKQQVESHNINETIELSAEERQARIAHLSKKLGTQ